MPAKKSASILSLLTLVVAGLVSAAAPVLAADKFTVLYSFGGGDGTQLRGSLISDAAGNLYGTTWGGGDYTYGTVFELIRGGGGRWKEKVLYSFCAATHCADGAGPYDGLIMDSSGNLYGTTNFGGSGGTVFQLTPGPHGGWTEKVLQNFGSFAGLIFDAAGNLYGTTEYGGAGGYGTVFQLTPGADGNWTATVLHSFQDDGEDGIWPADSLVFDPAGNLYGTTIDGGSSRAGVIFQLAPGASGWTEQILHSFDFTSGAYPVAGLIIDASGNLYGTTTQGGAYNYGAVFELSPSGGESWTETVLHSFWFPPKDPWGGLISDAAGNLYGTTATGGTDNYGTVFRLSKGTDGKWTSEVLHSFTGAGGSYPNASLIFDAAGNLYGTTYSGGAKGGGTVFEVTR